MEEAVGWEEQIGQASQIRAGREGLALASALRRWAAGGLAPDPELPPVSTRECSSAIWSASSSSSPELSSEWMPVLDMLAGARDWTDWENGRAGERSEES